VYFKNLIFNAKLNIV